MGIKQAILTYFSSEAFQSKADRQRLQFGEGVVFSSKSEQILTSLWWG